MNKQGPTRDTFESGRRGLRHVSLRQANAKTVLTVIAFNSGASNAEISRLSGLAPQTVSAILVDLEEANLIERGPLLRGRRGQPATPILLAEDGGLAIGVEIGWRHLDIVLLNMHARILEHRHIDYAFPDAGIMVETISALVTEMVGSLTPLQRQRLLDLGIAMPGRLAENLHLLGAPPQQAELWRDIDLVGALQQRTGLSVSLFNDGNAGCWAELIALEPPRPANVIYLLVSHFLAAGIIGDGTLWEGPTGNAAELGSILVSREGQRPELAHRIASISALRSDLVRDGVAAAALPTQGLLDHGQTPQMRKWMQQAAFGLAQVIYNATTVVEQPIVVVDCILSAEMGAQLVEAIAVEIDLLPARSDEAPQVVMGKLGALAPAIGAAELPLFRRHF
jgi:predicted NBD/HSP70 family sugar kinase